MFLNYKLTQQHNMILIKQNHKSYVLSQYENRAMKQPEAREGA